MHSVMFTNIKNTTSACFCDPTDITAGHMHSLMFTNIKRNKCARTIIAHPVDHATKWFDVFAQLADLLSVGLIFLQVAGTRGGYCRTRSVQWTWWWRHSYKVNTSLILYHYSEHLYACNVSHSAKPEDWLLVTLKSCFNCRYNTKKYGKTSMICDQITRLRAEWCTCGILVVTQDSKIRCYCIRVRSVTTWNNFVSVNYAN
jgi:hypothetical protein